jgi:hypothetical protein
MLPVRSNIKERRVNHAFRITHPFRFACITIEPVNINPLTTTVRISADKKMIRLSLRKKREQDKEKRER